MDDFGKIFGPRSREKKESDSGAIEITDTFHFRNEFADTQPKVHRQPKMPKGVRKLNTIEEFNEIHLKRLENELAEFDACLAELRTGKSPNTLASIINNARAIVQTGMFNKTDERLNTLRGNVQSAIRKCFNDARAAAVQVDQAKSKSAHFNFMTLVGVGKSAMGNPRLQSYIAACELIVKELQMLERVIDMQTDDS